MTSWPALDVAIGLIFVYFLHLFASNINEAIATLGKWRAKDLKDGWPPSSWTTRRV